MKPKNKALFLMNLEYGFFLLMALLADTMLVLLTVGLYLFLPSRIYFGQRVNKKYLRKGIRIEAEYNPSLKAELTKHGFYK